MRVFLTVAGLLLLIHSCTRQVPSEEIDYWGNIAIYNVVIAPTDDEAVSIINHARISFDISGWTIGDLHDPEAFRIPDSTIIGFNEIISFVHDELGFKINNYDEIIYLKDIFGDVVDQWEGPSSADY